MFTFARVSTVPQMAIVHWRIQPMVHIAEEDVEAEKAERIAP